MANNDTLIALVTGANTGIGFHLTQQLARTGVRVLLGSRDTARGSHAAGQLSADGLDVDHLTVDVTDDRTIGGAVEHVAATYGRLDILINNAAIVGDGLPASKVSRASLPQTFDTNAAGIVAVTNAFLPLLRKSGSPRVLNVSSELGSTRLVNDPDWAHSSVAAAAYQASKSALDMLTVLYAKELAHEKISVLSVSPGYRATGLSKANPCRVPAIPPRVRPASWPLRWPPGPPPASSSIGRARWSIGDRFTAGTACGSCTSR
ncbi:SDR family NAD(P)-dependent oxidoreductase [Mycobacterium frederiksbergense]|uniref:SDR family NAD(P)-dependent oxidoreductase n=1 Tax=Mycolicibacterium frederiksbergense TaxID=117567 RepID=UPI0021F38A77|nr:SDR family NAD(P)-dependent oxidoreductase [Mycolicibacterium frederiksbergense]MCV7044114.1 SDR family NAD(P)-dependent oxidoreductase [Mycolicibacterium frederiksbergense]